MISGHGVQPVLDILHRRVLCQPFKPPGVLFDAHVLDPHHMPVAHITLNCCVARARSVVATGIGRVANLQLDVLKRGTCSETLVQFSRLLQLVEVNIQNIVPARLVSQGRVAVASCTAARHVLDCIQIAGPGATPAFVILFASMEPFLEGLKAGLIGQPRIPFRMQAHLLHCIKHLVIALFTRLCCVTTCAVVIGTVVYRDCR
mmetsp:Transcript_52664/g.104589  ORF Transcript_52664/g.104589 Transcript_52664/m.104589 type:complete len:203 (-) Transcript_52664:1217-1825(-)